MISLFTGIGGFDLASDVLGWDILLQSEIDEFCLQVLKKCFPDVPKYGDINEINAKKYRGNVDVVAGGFPCQPFSNAGLQKGQEDPRFYGRQCIELYKNVGRHGSSLKMFSDLLVTQTEWSSSKCALIWKVKATKYNRLLFQLRVRTLFKKGSEFGLLPALTASEAKRIKLRRESILKHSDKRKSNYLTAHISRAGFNPSDITPGWMEWFMGFPIGWTELTPSEMRLTRE